MRFWKTKLGKYPNKRKTGLMEKAAFWLVTTAMKGKRKLGDGYGFILAVKAAKNVIKKYIGKKD